MNLFLNLKNGQISVNTYRQAAGLETNQQDLIDSIDTDQQLTASVDDVDALPSDIRDTVIEYADQYDAWDWDVDAD